MERLFALSAGHVDIPPPSGTPWGKGEIPALLPGFREPRQSRCRFSPGMKEGDRGDHKPSPRIGGRMGTAVIDNAILEANERVRAVAERFSEIIGEVRRVIVGQAALLDRLLVALLADGHILLEGVPGLAKTLSISTLAKVMQAEFSRIQFTPDLLPADILGTSIFDAKKGRFTTKRGPVFGNLILADEVNRAPAKVQSALLEAMQERQVTVDGQIYRLSPPFITLATQNPLEQEGTYPLPEAQLDRFMFKLLVSYPSVEDEVRILHNYSQGYDHRRLDRQGLRPVLSAAQIIDIQQSLNGVIVEPAVLQYIAQIVVRTRSWPAVEVGASPRASVYLLLGARAMAACQGRNYVVPDDVKQIAPWVLRHRLRLSPEAEIDGTSVDAVIQNVLDAVPAPQPSVSREASG